MFLRCPEEFGVRRVQGIRPSTISPRRSACRNAGTFKIGDQVTQAERSSSGSVEGPAGRRGLVLVDDGDVEPDLLERDELGRLVGVAVERLHGPFVGRDVPRSPVGHPGLGLADVAEHEDGVVGPSPLPRPTSSRHRPAPGRGCRCTGAWAVPRHPRSPSRCSRGTKAATSRNGGRRRKPRSRRYPRTGCGPRSACRPDDHRQVDDLFVRVVPTEKAAPRSGLVESRPWRGRCIRSKLVDYAHS